MNTVTVTKICATCKTAKSINDFYRQTQTSEALRGSCKLCVVANNRRTLKDPTKRYYRDPNIQVKAKPEQTRKYKLKAKYGLTIAQYDAMYKSQKGRCAICRLSVTGRLHVDHCHATGKVRGLLCSRCNVTLGRFGDSLEIISRALKYLKKHTVT